MLCAHGLPTGPKITSSVEASHCLGTAMVWMALRWETVGGDQVTRVALVRLLLQSSDESRGNLVDVNYAAGWVWKFETRF